MKKDYCPSCGQPFEREVENAEEKLRTAIALETGKNIYWAIKKHLFRSIDLCNFCYATLRIYRSNLTK